MLRSCVSLLYGLELVLFVLRDVSLLVDTPTWTLLEFASVPPYVDEYAIPDRCKQINDKHFS